MSTTTKLTIRDILDRFGEHEMFIESKHIVGSFRDSVGEYAGLHVVDLNGTYSRLTATSEQQFDVTIISCLP